MIHHDGQRNGKNPNVGRKQGNGKFQDKKVNYSPSVNYNYNPSGSSYGSQQYGQQGGPRRRGDQHGRREFGGHQVERLIKQNDIIIRLLKDIRDRLPEPPEVPGDPGSEPQEQDQTTPGGDDDQSECVDTGTDGTGDGFATVAGSDTAAMDADSETSP
jgi:hypothetical protein